MSQVGDFDAGYGLAGFLPETRNPYLRRMSTHLHLQKLAAGITSKEDLVAWQSMVRERMRAASHGDILVVDTRNRPKRTGLLEGGSLYWIFAGAMQCRQQILGLHEAEGADGRSRCLIEIDPEIVSVRAVPRKPFQGWRYLLPAHAPPDLSQGSSDMPADLPAELRLALNEIGVL